MKPNIHPDYNVVAFHDTAADSYFIIGSTIKTDRTIELEGKTYPYVPIDVSSDSNHFILVSKKQWLVTAVSRSLTVALKTYLLPKKVSNESIKLA